MTIIAHAAGPFVEKETSLDTAASVTVQMSEHSPLYHLSRASAQGHRYHRFAMGGFKVQGVCVLPHFLTLSSIITLFRH